jgi:hypothetical protein
MAGTRDHRRFAAVKYRHPNASMIIEAKPVAIGSSHRIKIVHGKFLSQLKIGVL